MGKVNLLKEFQVVLRVMVVGGWDVRVVRNGGGRYVEGGIAKQRRYSGFDPAPCWQQVGSPPWRNWNPVCLSY
jgi:hypothetical protein